MPEKALCVGSFSNPTGPLFFREEKKFPSPKSNTFGYTSKMIIPLCIENRNVTCI
jgi:hypothetical protein